MVANKKLNNKANRAQKPKVSRINSWTNFASIYL